MVLVLIKNKMGLDKLAVKKNAGWQLHDRLYTKTRENEKVTFFGFS